MLSSLARALPRCLGPGLLLAGCSGEPMSVEEARSATVIEAAGAGLRGEVLERWLLAAAQAPGEEAAAVLVSGWIDEALLATAMQRGPALDDSATTDAVILPDAMRGSIVEFLQRRVAERAPPSDAQVDSLLDRDEVRVFQQIQLAVSAGRDPVEIERTAVRAAGIVREASQPGADFGTLVRRFTEDSVGRANAGFLPATTRNDMPGTIAGVVWNLRPGEVGAALRSSAGFHIFRRVTDAEARERLRTWLHPRLAMIDERRFIDSVVAAQPFQLGRDAWARVRAMAREPVPADSGPPLVSWEGGGLSGASARLWVMMLTPIERVTLSDASDSSTTTFLREVVRREILFALAVPEGGVSPRARLALAPAYRVALDSVKQILREAGGAEPLDPARAATGVIDSVVGLTRHFRPFPGALAAVLRRRFPVRVDDDAVGVLVRTARRSWIRSHTDSVPPGNR